jgi:hypothetical protein
MDGIGWALAQAKVVFQDGRHFYEKSSWRENEWVDFDD